MSLVDVEISSFRLWMYREKFREKRGRERENRRKGKFVVNSSACSKVARNKKKKKNLGQISPASSGEISRFVLNGGHARNSWRKIGEFSCFELVVTRFEIAHVR